MYRRYKADLGDSRASSKASVLPPAGHGSVNPLIHDVEQQPAERVVAECWREIESSNIAATAQGQHPQIRDAGGWKTVRIFVSSTFVDFHSEREVLVKHVFPVLRDWCAERKMTLVVVDLRWGVPKDSTTRQTIAACMEELDRCHEETGNKPFFINLLGERYGWIPGKQEVPEDIHCRYSWVNNVSITHMEILYGAYRCSNPNAAFFIRDSKVLDDVPDKHRQRFLDSDPLPVHHMQVLKEKLREKFSNRVFDYSCTYGGLDTSTGREKVKFEGLNDVGKQILEFLQEAIQNMYSAEVESKEMSKLEQENEAHEMLMQQKGREVYGRDAEIQMLMKFISQGQTDKFTAFMVKEDEETELETRYDALMKQFTCRDDETANVCIGAVSGIGKSALMASLALKIKQEGEQQVWYHNVSCSPASVDEKSLLTRLILALQDFTNIEGHTYEQLEGTSLAETQELFTETLEKVRNTDAAPTVVLVMDGLNELQSSDQLDHLSWLPPSWPSNIRCFISINTEHTLTVSRMSWRKPHYLQLEPLTADTRAVVVTSYFQQYNKSLDEEQLKSLLAKSSSSVALWLTLACEELRVFGDFATLNAKISSLPDSLPQLQTSIVHRLLQEDDTGVMDKVAAVHIMTS